VNIKIDKEMHEELNKHVLGDNTIEFGNLNGKDTDLLHIVCPNIQMDACIHNRDHFLFYKCEETNTDHLYITPRGAVNALITGSNTLIYEILVEGKFKGTYLEFLHSLRIEQFHTYKLVKALLGVAERDLKQSRSHTDTQKKLLWVKNYYSMAVDIMKDHGITVGMARRLGSQRVGLLDLKYARMRSQGLPKTVDDFVYMYLQEHLNLVGVLYFHSIEYVSYYYFNNWKESL
jgi:hypothetical protein